MAADELQRGPVETGSMADLELDSGLLTLEGVDLRDLVGRDDDTVLASAIARMLVETDRRVTSAGYTSVSDIASSPLRRTVPYSRGG